MDFGWLKVLDSSGCFFVTRAKLNMAYEVKGYYDIEGGVLEAAAAAEDQDVYLTAYASKKGIWLFIKACALFGQHNRKEIYFPDQ